MRVDLPMINWHGDAGDILSLEFFPNSNIIFTSGIESSEGETEFIKIWKINEVEANKRIPVYSRHSSKSKEIDSRRINPEFLSGLKFTHTKPVNIIRLSPNGRILATAGDDRTVVLWEQRSVKVDNKRVVRWNTTKLLRGHFGDIHTICWSPCNKYIISGSIDNVILVWEVASGRAIQNIQDHSNFVISVNFDPLSEFVLTLSCDKKIKVYKNIGIQGELQLFLSSTVKAVRIRERGVPLFSDEIADKSFFRRADWSPDGSIFLCPGGFRSDKREDCIWGFVRGCLESPAFFIPTMDKPSICIKFCVEPIKAAYREMVDLDYAFLYAVGMQDSVGIYSTDSLSPLYFVTNVHVKIIDDLAWQSRERLAVGSADGYISFLTFEEDELGEPAESYCLPSKLNDFITQRRSIRVPSIEKVKEVEVIEIQARPKYPLDRQPRSKGFGSKKNFVDQMMKEGIVSMEPETDFTGENMQFPSLEPKAENKLRPFESESKPEKRLEIEKIEVKSTRMSYIRSATRWEPKN